MEAFIFALISMTYSGFFGLFGAHLKKLQKVNDFKGLHSNTHLHT